MDFLFLFFFCAVITLYVDYALLKISFFFSSVPLSEIQVLQFSRQIADFHINSPVTSIASGFEHMKTQQVFSILYTSSYDEYKH